MFTSESRTYHIFDVNIYIGYVNIYIWYVNIQCKCVWLCALCRVREIKFEFKRSSICKRESSKGGGKDAFVDFI